ncbi:MAG: hypothetical protein RI897_1120 [Verrucomicrobiota bacterium]
MQEPGASLERRAKGAPGFFREIAARHGLGRPCDLLETLKNQPAIP